MLEKFFDAHLHVNARFSKQGNESAKGNGKIYGGCISLNSPEDVSGALKKSNDLIYSYGVHPQNPLKEDLGQFQSILDNGLINAVGECGFDFYTSDFRSTKKEQIEVFEYQLELAIKTGLPLVLHGRKCNEEFFKYALELKKCRSVLFHSFMGSFVEAQSFISKGINCYFSFGKQVMNGNKNVISCVKNLPVERLLCETDAPYQFLKGEEETYIEEIEKVYRAFYEMRPEIKKSPESKDADSWGLFLYQMEQNFKSCYGIPLRK